MLVRAGCEFTFETVVPTPSLWQVRPRTSLDQRITSETWDPPATTRTYLDAYGNPCDRLTLPGGVSTLRYDAVVDVPATFDDADKGATETPIDELPDEAFVYLLPSRFCWPDVLHNAAWELFGSPEPGWTRVQSVCDWLYNHIRYEPGSTSRTTAVDVWES